jgi:hypothetical protein
VAFLPGVKDRIDLAPGGRVAVTELSQKGREEQPRLALWDLDTSTVRCELTVSGDHSDVGFSPDGKYMFAHSWAWMIWFRHALRWWDTATGEQVGQIDDADGYALTAGGRVLVVPAQPMMQNGAFVPGKLRFWDVATGATLGEWTPMRSSVPLHWPNEIIGSGGERYLAMGFDPETGRGRDLIGKAGDKIHEWTVGGPPPDRERVVVWDTAERREVLRVSGKEPALSANGRWLATIDSQGVIRVWEVPARPAWGVLLWYSAIAAVCTTAFLLLAFSVARWWWPGRWRRWLMIAGFGFLLLLLGAYQWDSMATEKANVEFSAVVDQLHSSDGMTEAEVTAALGRPPDVVTVEDEGTKGGATRRAKWIGWWDKEIEMTFDENGKTGTSSISDNHSVAELIVGWLESLLP